MNSHPLLDWIESILPEASDDSIKPLKDSLIEAPDRIDKAYKELLGGYGENPGEIVKITAQVDESYSGVIEAVEIPFLSFCAHHFLPFSGTIRVAYEPSDIIIGIGKLPRLVWCRTRRFQIQEFLVKEIANDLTIHARARGVAVEATAAHMCVCYRGPNAHAVKNVCKYSTGTLSKYY